MPHTFRVDTLAAVQLLNMDTASQARRLPTLRANLHRQSELDRRNAKTLSAGAGL